MLRSSIQAAAMGTTSPASINKQRPGYAPGWVFGGLGWVAPAEFPALDRVAWGRPIAAGWRGGLVRAGAGRRAAFQALSAVGIGQVARLKSHRLAGMADFRAFWVRRRQIANYRTGRARALVLGPAGRSSARRAGGGFPLSARARPPYPGRARQTRVAEKPGRATPALTTGRDGTGCAEGAKSRRGPMGSGVPRGDAVAASARGNAGLWRVSGGFGAGRVREHGDPIGSGRAGDAGGRAG